MPSKRQRLRLIREANAKVVAEAQARINYELDLERYTELELIQIEDMTAGEYHEYLLLCEKLNFEPKTNGLYVKGTMIS